MAAHFALLVFLASISSLLQTSPSTTETTPIDCGKALVAAVERNDVTAVARLVELPIALPDDKQLLFARVYMLSSRLQWKLEEKLGERAATRAVHVAHLLYLPKVVAEEIDWLPCDVGEPGGAQPVRQRVMAWGSAVRMVKTASGWKFDLTGHKPAILVLEAEDAPWRSRVVQQVLDDLNAGKLSNVEQVIDALVPHDPVQAELVKADRSTPAGALATAAEAIDRGDADTFADSFEMIGGDAGGELRRIGEQEVLERRVQRALRERFAPEQVERIIRDGFHRPSLLKHYQQVAGWAIEDDVARAALKEGWYDVTRRMVRRNGIWRIQLPPWNLLSPDNGVTDNLKQEARNKALQEVLDHPERVPTVGAVLDALDETRKDMPKEDDLAAAARQQLEQMKRDAAANPPATPEEAAERAMWMSLWEVGVAVATKDAHSAAEHYFAEGDDGSYVLARERRLLAAQELTLAAARELGGEAGSVTGEFGLTNLADDVYALYMLELKIRGDRAIPTGDTHGEWVPGIRKIAGRWKIDVSDETAGKPKEAAVRADEEVANLRRLTSQVKAGKFTNVAQLRRAMSEAGIKGTRVAGR